MIRGLEHMKCEERLGEKGFFNLEKRLGEDPIEAFQYLRGGYQKDGDRLFMKGHSRKIRDSGYRLKADGYIYTHTHGPWWKNEQQ